ncbi:MAG TPA: YceI family protein [Solirubrobacteraceae bacterium]|nr:YceI family protein [Solirubrobacteraceae bacterium]
MTAGTRPAEQLRRRESPAPLPAGAWRVDTARSAVGFRLRHLMLVPVRGRFVDFEGSIEVEPDGRMRAGGSVAVATIDTGDAVRDDRLRSPDYFDAEQFPRIVFATTSVEALNPRSLRIRGELTVKATTQPIELHAWRRSADAESIELDVEGKLSRGAFGIDSAQLLDAGISDRVEVRMAIALVPARR